MKANELDDLDKKIIASLSQDARTSNRELARKFAVTEGTIRTRLKRLLDERVIRITAISNAHRLKGSQVAFLWIDVENGAHIKPVATTLAELPQIYYVATMLGRCDVVAVTLVEDSDQLINYIHNTVDQIPGIHRVQYTLSHQFVKHDHRWTMILPESKA